MAVSQTLTQVVDLVSEHKVEITVAFVAVYFLSQIRTYFKLAHVPGPWFAGWSDIPHNWSIWNERAYQYYYDISERYGKIARIGPNSVLSSAPEVWIHVNTKPGYRRSDWYFKAVRVEYQRDNIFSQADTEKHDATRKKIAPGYSGRENLELEGSVDSRVVAFLDLIRRNYLSVDGGPVKKMDLAKKIQFFTMDVISLVAFGTTFGMLDRDSDINNFVKSSEDGLLIGNMFMSLNLAWLVQAPVIGKFLGPSPKDKTGFGAMMRETFRYIEERVENAATDTRMDMLASFYRHGMRGDELKSEVLEQMVAGSDTTAGALRGIMLHVLGTPRVQKKLQEEIDAVHAKRTWGDGIVPHAVAKQMPYMQAVIREGLRIWPPVLNLLPKDVPAGGDTIVVDGKKVFLPGGTCIGVSTLAMHHDKELYGEDADVFRPERWLLETDQQKLAMMTRINDLTFGHGKWQCLGKPVAQMEINKMLFEWFRNFDWAVAKPSKPWRLTNAFGLFLINDFYVRVMERET
ncbi:Putative cytochrome P450 E-class, group I [Podospora comata]|uniref:Cytochrome P450 E-class, group I n=1 Tax=Podospora comata TaxID=48703 RepID=A0ABY6SDL5_PODCO|nr:Putative cytochrome P450 E-class, group I [Podospora comata]